MDTACDRSVQGTMNQMSQDIEHVLHYDEISVAETTAYRQSAWFADRPMDRLASSRQSGCEGRSHAFGARQQNDRCRCAGRLSVGAQRTAMDRAGPVAGEVRPAVGLIAGECLVALVVHQGVEIGGVICPQPNQPASVVRIVVR